MCGYQQLHVWISTATCVYNNSYMCVYQHLYVWISTATCVNNNSYMCVYQQLHVWISTATCVDINKALFNFFGGDTLLLGEPGIFPGG
jgi:hypothetical protein